MDIYDTVHSLSIISRRDFIPCPPSAWTEPQMFSIPQKHESPLLLPVAQRYPSVTVVGFDAFFYIDLAPVNALGRDAAPANTPSLIPDLGRTIESKPKCSCRSGEWRRHPQENCD